MNQDKDSLYREITILALLNKASDQLALLMNDNNDARFRNISTQVYTIKQDLEDKMREDFVDEDIVIAAPPVIPDGDDGDANSQNASSGTATNTNGVPTNANGNNVPTQNGNNVPKANANTTSNNSAIAFFDSLIAGATANNSDLADALNQLDNATNSDSDENDAPF